MDHTIWRLTNNSGAFTANGVVGDLAANQTIDIPASQVAIGWNASLMDRALQLSASMLLTRSLETTSSQQRDRTRVPHPLLVSGQVTTNSLVLN